jgi:hypothetical protein
VRINNKPIPKNRLETTHPAILNANERLSLTKLATIVKVQSAANVPQKAM